MPAAAGIVGGSLVGSVVSGIAAQGAARDQLAAQQQQRQQALAAANSPEEIQQLQSQIQLNNQDIARKQKLLDSTDPALLEAGKQTLQLLQGKEAATLSPLKSQQAQARKQLEDKLRAQLGPGYANTTAGLQALSQFDNAAFNSTSQAQQQSLSQLLGVTQNTNQGASLMNNIAMTGSIASSYGNIANRNVSAINQTSLTPYSNSNVGLAALGNGISGAAANYSTLNSLFGGQNTSTNPWAGDKQGTGPLAIYGNK